MVIFSKISLSSEEEMPPRVNWHAPKSLISFEVKPLFINVVFLRHQCNPLRSRCTGDALSLPRVFYKPVEWTSEQISRPGRSLNEIRKQSLALWYILILYTEGCKKIKNGKPKLASERPSARRRDFAQPIAYLFTHLSTQMPVTIC